MSLREKAIRRQMSGTAGITSAASRGGHLGSEADYVAGDADGKDLPRPARTRTEGVRREAEGVG